MIESNEKLRDISRIKSISGRKYSLKMYHRNLLIEIIKQSKCKMINLKRNNF